MNILVTGSNGQLGSEIKVLSHAFPQYNFIFTDIAELDITSKESVSCFFEENKIDLIINAAAYTAVDKAESDKDNAMLVNSTAVKILSEASEKYNAFLIHTSTDYVFDGNGKRPYLESDSVSPQSVYGSSKLSGEVEMQKICRKGIIIRTAWLYSAFGNNFVKTILRVGKERGELKVVNDQFGSPTYAADLAKAIIDIIPQIDKIDKVELFHYSNEGIITWFDFAKAIIESSGINCKVNPVSSAEFPTPVKRPSYSVLDKSKIKSTFGIEVPSWKESLEICLGKLLA
jgi:dTDP-4-dehydrorhamnose reductase